MAAFRLSPDRDVGAGRTAHLTVLFRLNLPVDIYNGYYGIDDNTPERLLRIAQIAGVAGRVEAKVGDARKLPLETGAYDPGRTVLLLPRS